jgi:hypothetical protein
MKLHALTVFAFIAAYGCAPMPSGIGLPDGTLVASGRTEYQTPVFKEEIHFSEGNTPISVYGSPSGAYMTTGRWPASYRNPQRYRDARFFSTLGVCDRLNLFGLGI